MKKTIFICDVCGAESNENFNYHLSIGAFKDQAEIQIRTSFFRCGVFEGSRWLDVDLCSACKLEVVRTASWFWGSELKPENYSQVDYKDYLEFAKGNR